MSSSRTRIAAASFLPLLALSCNDCETQQVQVVTGTVSGTLCNPTTGLPQEGVTVGATYVDPVDGVTEKSVETTTDERGNFDLPGVPPGERTVDVSSDIFEFSFDVTVEARKSVQYRHAECRDQLGLPGVGALAGQICNRHLGRFVGGANVTIRLASGDTLTAQTDAEGRFLLENIPVGNHIAVVVADAQPATETEPGSPGYRKSYQVEIKEKDEPTLIEEQMLACNPPNPTTTASISGKICAADPSMPEVAGASLVGARVSIVGEIDGAVFEDETNDEGEFLITGIPVDLAEAQFPNGVKVRAEKGGFSYTWENVQLLTLTESMGEAVQLTADEGCDIVVPNADLRYLVVNGIYDQIQAVLGRLEVADVDIIEGAPADLSPWAFDIFGDYERMSGYDAIFVNCGVDEGEFAGRVDPVMVQNLKRYVQSGGALYVSDWAYELIELTWPEKVDFYSFDTDHDAAQFGAGKRTYRATVEDEGLARYLATQSGEPDYSIDIAFTADSFTLVSAVAEDVTVLLSAPVKYHTTSGDVTFRDGKTPITLMFTDGPSGVGGRVIFTTFHQELIGDQLEVLDGPEDAVLRYVIFAL